jgi:ComF family protein
MEILRQIIDIIYPPRCGVCSSFMWEAPLKGNTSGLSICDSCLMGFHELSSPLCTMCGAPFLSEVLEDHPCEDCLRNRPAYAAAGAPYLYEGSLLEAIHHLKYHAKTCLAGSLGSLLGRFAQNWLGNESTSFLIIPVPLHRKKLRERGYNQSLLLARHTAKKLGTDLDCLSLRRSKNTAPQTGLGKKLRRKNVRNAFKLENVTTIKGRNILLVDDVSTTGNTLNACSKTLIKGGANKIYCITLARAAGF